MRGKSKNPPFLNLRFFFSLRRSRSPLTSPLSVNSAPSHFLPTKPANPRRLSFPLPFQQMLASPSTLNCVLVAVICCWTFVVSATDSADVADLRARVQARSLRAPPQCHPVYGMTEKECVQLEAKLSSTTDACTAVALVQNGGIMPTGWTGPYVVWAGSGCPTPCAIRANQLGLHPVSYCNRQKSQVTYGDGGCQYDYQVLEVLSGQTTNPNLPNKSVLCNNVQCESVCLNYKVCVRLQVLRFRLPVQKQI